MPVLLIHPPAGKPCEPPPGLARLAAALKANGVGCRLLDANIEGLLDLAKPPLDPQGAWTRRALKTREASLTLLRSPEITATREPTFAWNAADAEPFTD